MSRRRSMGVLIAAFVVAASGVLADEAPAKKRGPPPPAPSLIAKGVRYQAATSAKGGVLDRDGGYITATDLATGRERWVVKVYSVHVDPEMERDKQDLFIAKLALANHGHALMVTDERGGRYRLDLKTRAVTRP